MLAGALTLAGAGAASVEARACVTGRAPDDSGGGELAGGPAPRAD
jgi:hypothetical protein